MRAVDLIQKKRDGGRLTRGEYDFLVRGLLEGSLPDYQAAAFLMAAFLCGMDPEEAADLTLAMVTSGGARPVPAPDPARVDKHSTGGVGDKTTLVVAPLVAACGVPVAKMSGRGLGHTGGTLDKLEAIPGFRVDLSGPEVERAVRRAGLAVVSQGADLVPADKILYALRDVTATVECPALIAASVMSKKIAGGAGGIVLDVKAGSGAFCKTLDQARALARLMVDIGRAAGRRVVALITDMSQPLGRAVGNALEVEEAMAALRGQGPPDLVELSLALAEEMLLLASVGLDRAAARAQLERALAEGRALERLRLMIEAQGGDPAVVERPELLPRAGVEAPARAPAGGYVAAVDAEAVGRAAMLLGAGRARKEDRIDPGVGVVVAARVGDEVAPGQALARVLARSPQSAAAGAAAVAAAFRLQDVRPQPPPLLIDRLGP